MVFTQLLLQSYFHKTFFITVNGSLGHWEVKWAIYNQKQNSIPTLGDFMLKLKAL